MVISLCQIVKHNLYSQNLPDLHTNCLMGKKSMKKNGRNGCKFLKKKYKHTPQVGIILGSGLGNFIDEIEVETEVPYEDIPHFPVSTVKGHKGKLVFGKLSGKNGGRDGGPFSFL